MSARPRIDALLIEAEESDYFLLRELISELSGYHCEPVWASDAQRGLEELLAGQYDICLVGYSVGSSSGIELLRRARQAGFDQPGIVLVNQADYAGMSLSASREIDDYLIKEQLNPLQLERAFRYTFELHRSRRLLLESEAINRILFEENPAPACLYDSETGRFLAVNRAARACYGHSEAEMLRMTIPDVFAAGEGDRFMQRSAIEAEGFVDLGEWRQRRADGDDAVVVIRQHALSYAGRSARLLLLEDVTEQHRQARAFDDYRQLARQLYDQLPSGVWLADGEARPVEGNVAACRLFGVDEAPAFEALELSVDGRTRLAFHDWSLPRALASGRAEFDPALMLKTSEGQKTLISYSVPLSCPVRGVSAAWICLDVSVLSQAARERTELITVLSLLDVGVAVLAGDGAVRFTNETAKWCLHDPSAMAALRARFDTTRWNDDEQVIELVNPHDGGRTWWVTTRPIDWQGEPAWLCILRDMTRTRATEQRLRLYERVAEVCVNGIAIADCSQPDNPVIAVNPAFERMTGYRAEEVLGRNCRFLQKDDHDQPNLRLIRQALQERRTGKALLRNYRKDDTLFWNEFRVAPVFDDDGRLTHYIGILDDVSDYKRYEQELARLANHDRLTGLPNRKLFETRLKQALLFAERFGKRIVVLHVNLDRFSGLNKTFGHEAGSRLIRLVAERMASAIGEQDTLARLDGVEFVALLIRDTDESIMQAAQSLREAVNAPVVFEQQTLTLSCSMGVGAYPEQGSDARQLMHLAYLAMHEAREQGGDRICHASDPENRPTPTKGEP